MPLPNRTDLITWWQNPVNVIPYSPATGGIYSQHYPSRSNWWPNSAPVANDISISIDRDGRPLIFLWGNLADFSDIPTSSSSSRSVSDYRSSNAKNRIKGYNFRLE